MIWLSARTSKHFFIFSIGRWKGKKQHGYICQVKQALFNFGVGNQRKDMAICKVESSCVWNWKGKDTKRKEKELGYIFRYLFRIAQFIR